MTSGAEVATRDRSIVSERLWMLITALIFFSLAASWVPALSLPLGDDHQGRILARMALHADNFVARGWSGSNYIADWMPYSSVPYAHHPPLPQFVHAGVAWLAGGATAFGVRTVDFVGGVASIGLLVAFVRRLSGSWLPAAFAVAGLAASGFFWLFGRSWGLLFAGAFFLVHLVDVRGSRASTRTLLLLVALFGTLHSWQAALTIGLLALYDFFRTDRKRALVSFAGLAIGFAIDVLWIESAAGIAALAGHLEERVAAADYGAIEWFARQVGFLLRFEAVPVVVVTLIGLVAGLRDPRYRPYVGASFVAVFLFAVAFYQNAWVHEYWNWRISLVLALGMAAIGSWLISLQPPDWTFWLVAGAAIALAAIPLLRLGGDLYATQYVESSKAGALVERTEFSADQDLAWYHGGISGPRWYAWYTGMPVRQFDPDNPPASATLVLVKREPGEELVDLDPIDSLGQYAFVPAGSLGDVAD